MRRPSSTVRSEHKLKRAFNLFRRENTAPLTRAQFQDKVRGVAPNLRAYQTHNKRLTDADVDALARGINYKNARDVRRAVDDAAQWLKRQVGDKPYAILTYEDTDKFKSGDWLAPRIVQAIGRWPAVVLPKDDLDDERARLERLGVKTFVYLDDATYSGTQIEELMDDFDSDAPPGAKLFVAAGFASKQARNLVTPRANHPRLAFYAPGTLRQVDNFLGTLPNAARTRVANLFANSFHNFATTLAAMAHKVPDEMSFPNALGYHLAKAVPEPPYKRSTMEPNVEYGRTYQHGGVRYMSMKRKGNRRWRHVAFTYSRRRPVVVDEFTSIYPGKRALAFRRP